MFSFRGDAHKIYLQLKRASQKNEPFSTIKDLTETEEIIHFYQQLKSTTLKTIKYRMIKEKNGSGIIPIFVTAVPWFFFLFSKQLQQFLFKNGSTLWIYFVLFYFITLTTSVILHFREKAWAAFHIQIIEDIMNERENVNYD